MAVQDTVFSVDAQLESEGVRLLDGLDAHQMSAVTTPAPLLCILAGAGSGKTRVLTRRIAYRIHTGKADAPKTLALTFTRKAASELTTRLATLGVSRGVTAATFHSAALNQLRGFWSQREMSAPTLRDKKFEIIRSVLPRGFKPTAVMLRSIATEIEWAKARLIGYENYEQSAKGRITELSTEVIASVYRGYEAEKVRRNIIDFDDILLRCIHAIETDADFAASQHWRFRHFFVDEFQDVNPAQLRLLHAWRGGREDLCVVGDPNQAIYSFNGADPRALIDLPQQLPGMRVVKLKNNYRCSPEILTVAESLIPNGSRANPVRPNGSAPVLKEFDSEANEAAFVARTIKRDLAYPPNFRRYAVLSRTNSQLHEIAVALRNLGIPYSTGQGGSLLAKAEIKDIFSELGSTNPHAKLSSIIGDLEEIIERLDVKDSEARLNQEWLVKLARELSQTDPESTLASFKPWISVTVDSDRQADEQDNVVELLTLHRAKGLQWHTVFVTGLEKGFVPIAQANDPASLAEEKRLLYVGLTRAEQHLYISWAQTRQFGEKTGYRSRSPWADEIETAIKALKEPAGNLESALRDVRARRAKAAREHSKSRARSTTITFAKNADPELVSALKKWRTDKARKSGQPAYVIFHDITLAALAEHRPKSIEQLGSIAGLGPVKIERFGEEIIELCRRTVSSQ